MEFNPDDLFDVDPVMRKMIHLIEEHCSNIQEALTVAMMFNCLSWQTAFPNYRTGKSGFMASVDEIYDFTYQIYMLKSVSTEDADGFEERKG